jgi:hypothetical protein
VAGLVEFLDFDNHQHRIEGRLTFGVPSWGMINGPKILWYSTMPLGLLQKLA